MIYLLYNLITMADDGLIFLHSAHTRRCRATVDKHFDAYCSFQLMTEGGIELSYDRQQQTLTGPWLWCCWPGPHIRFHVAGSFSSWEHRYVAFKGSLVHRWWSEGLLFRQPQALTGDRGDFVARFDQLLRVLRTPGAWSQKRATNMLEDLLLRLAEARAVPRLAAPWLESVFQALDRGPLSPSQYAALAAELGLSLVTLRRRFHHATGMPLHTYALQCRMAQACRQLGETDLPIKSIAAQLGFHDVYYFTRQFRLFAGVPPAAYRRSRQ